MKYFGGCDVGSTYAKCVILDENGKMVADATVRSKINPVQSAELALGEAIGKVDDINSAEDLSYLIGTGYGRNKVPFADENISEISCHAMGVHVTNPAVKAIIDIGGQDVKGIAIDTDGTVKNFAMNDKCAAGTGRFFEAMANAFEKAVKAKDGFLQPSIQAFNQYWDRVANGYGLNGAAAQFSLSDVDPITAQVKQMPTLEQLKSWVRNNGEA